MSHRSEYSANLDMSRTSPPAWQRPATFRPDPKVRELSWLSRLIVRICGF